MENLPRRSLVRAWVLSLAVLFLALPARGQAPFCPPPRGLVGWWTADADGRDLTGINHGTLTGDAMVGFGRVGSGFHFGGGGAVEIADSPSLAFGTGDFSVEFWVQFNNLQDGANGILSKDSFTGDPFTATGWVINVCQTCGDGTFGPGSGGFGFETRRISANSGPHGHARWNASNLSTRTWYHVAAVRKASVLYLYVDGTLRATTPESEPVDVNTSALMTLGTLNPVHTQSFDGLLDEVALYERALSPTEIAETFALGAAGRCKNFEGVPDSRELVVNGTFEGGNAGFTSDYVFSPGNVGPESTYAVSSNPQALHPEFYAAPDHTSGSGRMLIANGSTTTGGAVWKQTVPVTAGKSYRFSGWAANLVASAPANLSLVVNGTPIGSPRTLPLSPLGRWVGLEAAWPSGTATSATLEIRNLEAAAGGNDFAIDDISFLPNDPGIASQSGDITPNVGDTVTLSVTPTGTAPFTFQWRKNGLDIPGETGASLTLANVQVSATGDYTVRVSNGVGTQTSLRIQVRFPGTAVVSFPDTNLEAAVRAQLSKPTDPITVSDLENMNRLDTGNGRGIRNLEGLETAIQLYVLNLRENQIEDLRPIAGLTGLNYLYLGANRITDLAPLKGLAELIALEVQDNRITNLTALSSMGRLLELNASGNPLQTFSPLSSLTSLKALVLQRTPPTDLTPLSGLVNLERLILGAGSPSPLRSLQPIQGLSKLIVLGIDSTGISDLSLLTSDRYPNLRELFAGENGIRDLGFVQRLPALERLFIPWNPIVDLKPLAHCPSLQFLHVDGCPLNDISTLSQLVQLREFYCRFNILNTAAGTPTRTILDEIGARPNAIVGYNDQRSLPAGFESFGNRLWLAGESAPFVVFTAGDPARAGDLISVRATSSNPQVLKDSELIVRGSGTVYSLEVAPATLASGSTTITVTATYSTGPAVSGSFVLTVDAGRGVARDRVGNVGLSILGKADYSPDTLGRSGTVGDRSLDFGYGDSHASTTDMDFLRAAAAGDTISISVWQKLREVSDSAILAAVKADGSRTIQVHTPWSDNRIYFDTGGCCDGARHRVSQHIGAFSAYTGSDDWWKTWHNFVFVKQGAEKRVYIDGVLFHEGTSTDPLLPDFQSLWIGGDNGASRGAPPGWVDDLAVFNDALTPEQIATLAQGTSPTNLPGLAAFWDFNDAVAHPEAVSDPALAEVVRNSLRILDRPLAPEDLKFLTHLYAGEKGVRSLAGLESAVNLIEVYLVGNPIVDLSPLSGLSALQMLHIPGTAVRDLAPIASLRSLRQLFLDDTRVTDLGPIAGLTNLTLLSLNRSGARDLAPLSGLGALENLGFEACAVSSVAPLATVSNLVSIRFSLIAPDDLTTFTAERFPRLRHFAVFGGVKDLAFLTHAPPFESLNLGWNPITDLRPLAGQTGLQQLWINSCIVSDLSPLAALTSLRELYCDVNYLDVSPGSAARLQIAAIQAREGSQVVFEPQRAPAPVVDGIATRSSFGGQSVRIEFSAGDPARLADLVSISASSSDQTLVRNDRIVLRGDGLVRSLDIQPEPLANRPVTVTITLHYASGPPRVASFELKLEGGHHMTRDRTANRGLAILGAAGFSTAGAGHTGEPTDYALDFGLGLNRASATMPDTLFLNRAAAGDDISISVWQKFRDPSASLLFYGHSPNVGPGLQALVPDGGRVIQWDSNGCCNPDIQRVGRSISDFPNFAGDPAWWNRWHHFVFTKDGPVKKIYIDGILFHQALNTGSLPKDSLSFSLGTAGGSEFNAPHGWVDDVAVFDGPLTPEQVALLTQGTTPLDLPGSAAFWDFNDAPVGTTPALDTNLASAIRAELGITDRPLVEADLLSLTRLDLRGKGVLNLSGLEKASNLTWLDLSVDGSLSADAPERTRDVSFLSQMPQLEWLNISGLALRSIEFLRSMPRLAFLNIDNAPRNVSAISDYSPLNTLTALRELYLQAHPLGNASMLQDLKQLTTLSLNWSVMTNADHLASLPLLAALSLHNLDLESVQFLEGMPQLRGLDLGTRSASRITVQDLSVLQNLTNMASLELVGRPITTADQIAPVLRRMPYLGRLGLDSTPLSDGSALSEFTSLTWLDISNTRLKSLQFLRPLTGLRNLYANNWNRSIEVPESDWNAFSSLPNLVDVSLSANNLRRIDFLGSNLALQGLRLDVTSITDIGPLIANTQLVNLYINSALLTDLTPALSMPALRYIDASGNPLLPPEATGGRDIMAEVRARGVTVLGSVLPVGVTLNASQKLTTSAGLIRGLNGRIHQTYSAPSDNTLLRAEQQLAGNFGPSSVPTDFIEGGRVNYSNDPGRVGRFGNDSPFPNTIDPMDVLTARIQGYLELRAGWYLMGVNSDDGFGLSAGFAPLYSAGAGGAGWAPNPEAVILGSFDSGRGSVDSVFLVKAPEDGLYPMRLIWEEGGGAANLEWWVVDLQDPSGSRQVRLINDAQEPAALKAFAVPPTSTSAPSVKFAVLPPIVVEAGSKGTVKVPFVVVDAETSTLEIQASLNVVATTSTPGSLPEGSFRVLRSSEGFVLEILPEFAKSGAASVQVIATDAGGLSGSAQLTFLVVDSSNTVGYLRRELYEGILGNLISDLRQAPIFPDHPTKTFLIPSLEATGYADNYGQRISGYLMPPATGDYVFYISGDDNSELWLSTDASPANKVRIAYEPIWNSSRAWQSTLNRNASNPETRSVPIRLELGRAYYLEVLQKEGGGGDHVEVAWQMPGGSPPVDGSEPIPGRYFSANPPTQDQLPVKMIPATEGTLVVNPVNHHGYYLLAPSSWHEAEAAAKLLGGHLVTINDATEQDWVSAQFGGEGATARGLWIGLRKASDLSLYWVSGQPVSYTHWFQGSSEDGFGAEPNGGANEMFVHMLRAGYHPHVPAGTWNDLASPNLSWPGFEPIQGVVEVEGDPIALPALQDKVVAAGSTVRFEVTPFGTPPLTLQWRKNGLDLPGETGSTLTLNGVQGSDTGEYSLVVRNSVGSHTTAAARLRLTPSSPVVFVDTALEGAVRAALSKPVGDVLIGEMEGLTSLSARGLGIQNLSGLESAVNLVNLDLTQNLISDLRPLSSLALLQSLVLEDNRVTDLSPLAHCQQLSSLNVQWGSNRLQTLATLGSMPRLESLAVSGTGLTDYSALTVDRFPSLRHLYAVSNGIGNVEFLRGISRHLMTLYLNGNPIGSLAPLTGLAELSTLSISDIRARDFGPIAAGSLPSLQALFVAGNEITDLSVLSQVSAELTLLDMDRNPVISLSPLVRFPKLNWLFVRETGAKDYSILTPGRFPNLGAFLAGGNGYRDVNFLTWMPQLFMVDVGGNPIVDLSPVASQTRLQTLYAGSSSITDVEVLRGISTLLELFVSNARLDVSDGSAARATLASLQARGVSVDYLPQQPLPGGPGAIAAKSVFSGHEVFDIFTAGDPTRASEILSVTATSSNQSIIRDSDIRLRGQGIVRSIEALTLPTAQGVTIITVTTIYPGETVRGSFTVTSNPIHPSSLFIEAEDFDFGRGQRVQGQPIGVTGPYPGGAYEGLGSAGDADIDWHTLFGNGGAPYRATTGVGAGKRNQHVEGFNRGSFDVTVNHIVGWNDDGDWQNYTRDFPPGFYNILSRQSGPNSSTAVLDEVIYGFGTKDQITRNLGTLQAPPSGGWDIFQVVPLRDTSGAGSRVYLSGTRTLRLTKTGGSVDFDFLALSPAAAVDPGIEAQPHDLFPNPGDNVSIAVTPVGTAPFTFQWFKNGSEIPNQTGATLPINNVQLSDAGDYSVVVRNTLGSYPSGIIALRFPGANTSRLNLPNIVTPPEPKTVNLGEGVVLSVKVDGATPGGIITRAGDRIVASSLSSPVAERAPNAIDGNANTKYLNLDTHSGGIPSGFVVSPSLGVTRISGVSLQSANDAPDRDPKVIMIEGSNDSVDPTWTTGNWELIARLDNIPAFPQRFQTQSFEFPNLKSFRHYRFTVLEVQGVGVAFQIAEVGLLGVVTDLTYQWQKDGANLVNETGTDLHLNPTTPDHAGLYRVRVGNSAGTVDSTEARLTVIVPNLITDANLERVIRTALNKPNGPLTQQDLASLTQLNLRGQGVLNLSGLEKAVNLTFLDLSVDQSLPTDHPERRRDLSGLNRLTRLNWLSLDGLAVTSLEFMRSMPNLVDLHLVNLPKVMSITDYSPIAEAVQMVNLNMQGHSFPSAAVFKNLKALRLLWLNWGNLPDASDLATLPVLHDLRLHNVGLTSLAFLQGMTQLEFLALGHEGASPVPTTALSVLQNLTHLTWLALDGRGISQASQIVPFLKPISTLRELWLSGCPLVDGTALSQLTQLSLLGVPNTRLTSLLFLRDLPQLQVLDVGNWNGLLRIPEGDWSVLADLPALVVLNLSAHGFTDLNFLASNTALQDLWIDQTSIADLSPLANFIHLTQLRVNDAYVSDLTPLMGLTALRNLAVSRNPILPPAMAGGRDWIAELRASGVTVTADSLVPAVRLPTQGKLNTRDGMVQGFSGNIHQTPAAGFDNSLLRAERQLAGDLGASSVPSAFFEPGSINYDNDGGNPGRIGGDRNFPNLNGFGIDNLAMSVTGYVELKAGRYLMGVNSDDGFAVSAGLEPTLVRNATGSGWVSNAAAPVLGSFDGGRGSSDTVFVVEVTEDGLYPLRLIWEEGGGGANLEWWVINLQQNAVDRRRVLINGPETTAPKVYTPTPTLTAPTFVTPLVGKALNVGQRDSVSVQVAGQLLHYQWFRDGQPLVDDTHIQGSRSATLVFTPFEAIDVGNYSVVVTNAVDRIESPAVAITARSTSDYVQLSAASRVVPDLNKPGFSAWVHQVGVAQPNSIDRAERQLLGLLKTSQGEPLPNLANLSGLGADGRFQLFDVINFNNFADSANGEFLGDRMFPGLPGIMGSFDNVAMELVTYIQLPQGVVRMGINSDDGFETTTGRIYDSLARTVLGRFDGLRGAGTTLFDFYVPEAGYYPFRTVWEQGGGGATLEWFTVRPDGSYVLLNDIAHGGLPAYSRLATPVQTVDVALVEPGRDTRDARVNSQIAVTLLDAGQKLDLARLALQVGGTSVVPTTLRSGDRVSVTFVPTTPYPPDTQVEVRLIYPEVGDVTHEASWSFRTSVLAANAFFIEAEDFDFGKGQWVRNVPIGMTGAYAGGAYDGLGTGVNGTLGDGSDLGVDYYEPSSSNDGSHYRLNTGVEVNARALDGGRSSRGVFDVVSNYAIGWNNDGDWYNYTRPFPVTKQQYRVFASLSSGGSPMSAELSRVVSGHGTTQQVTQSLGRFKTTTATGGWDVFTLVELTDTQGAPVQPVLGGTNTLRFTVLPGNLDIDYMAFVPVPGTEVVPPTLTRWSLAQTAYVGSEVRFEVSAAGTGPLSYQWKKGTQIIPDATSPTYVIPSAKLTDSGDYSVVVRNAADEVVSVAMPLTVQEVLATPVEFRVGQVAGARGAEVAVPVRVRGFSGIGSVQFTMHWDPSAASFGSVSGFGLGGLAAGSFNLSQVNEGILTLSWDDPLGVGQTLVNDSAIFQLNLAIIAGPGISSAITLDGVPTAVEVSDSTPKAVPYLVFSGGFTVLNTVEVAGAARYFSNPNLMVPGVEVGVTGTSTASTVTSGAGTYGFTVNAGGNYDVRATKASETPAAQGVTTLDITLVRRQILGITPLDSPYKQLAADVNRSGTVTTLDITLMRRVILALTNNFPGGAWVFVPSNTSFPTPTAPWGFDPLRRYTGLSASQAGQDFIGVKLGDVNGSWTPPSATPPPPAAQPVLNEGTGTIEKGGFVPQEEASRSLRLPGLQSDAAGARVNGGGILRLSLGEGEINGSGELEVPVRVSGSQRVHGMQFSVEWNPALFEWVRTGGNGLPGFNEGNMNALEVSSGRLSVAWDDAEGFGVDVSEVPVVSAGNTTAQRLEAVPGGAPGTTPGSNPGSADIPVGSGGPLASPASGPGREVMRLTFRPKATKPSAGLIRFAQVPTPVEVVTGDEVASTQTQNTMVWLGRSPMDSALRLPGLGAASGSGGSELRVPTWVGVTSVIETTQDLGAKDWREVGRIVGDGTVAGWPVTVSDPGQGYYRVRWEP